MKIIDKTKRNVVPLSSLAAREFFVLPGAGGSYRGPYRVSTEQRPELGISVFSLLDFTTSHFTPRCEVEPVQLTLTVQPIEPAQPSTPGGEEV